MKCSEVTDCDNCPIRGDVCKNYIYRTRIPGEPPCAVWADDWEVDEYGIYTPFELREKELDNKLKEMLNDHTQ